MIVKEPPIRRFISNENTLCEKRDTDTSVSVIIPVYNGEKYIQKAILSVLEQTFPPVEIIIVDDASTDQTLEIVAKNNSPKIKIVRNLFNRGPSFSRNRGIELAVGAWVAILDADDWFTPHRLERLLLRAAKYNADVVADDLFLIDEEETQPKSSLFIEFGFDVEGARKLHVLDMISEGLSTLKPIFKRALFSDRYYRYNEDIIYGEDLLLYLDLLGDGVSFFVFAEPSYYQRGGNTGSLSTKRVSLLTNTITLLQNIQCTHKCAEIETVRIALKAREKVFKQRLCIFSILEPLRAKRYSEAFSKFRIDGTLNFGHALISRLPHAIKNIFKCKFRRMKYSDRFYIK